MPPLNSMNLGTVHFAVEGRLDGLKAGISEAARQLKVLEVGAKSAADKVDSDAKRIEASFKKIEKTANTMKSAGQALTVAFTVPLAAIAKQSTDMASDTAESLSKVQQVFKTTSKGITDWAQNAARDMGQSRQEAMEAAATFGNLFQTMKVGEADSNRMSTNLVQLASDLASFNNADPSEMLEKLRSGLVGEVEPLRTVGVALNAAMVEAKALEMGLASAKDEISEADKVAARYALIMEQTASAHGDFARTADNVANKERILKAEYADAAAELGRNLLPAKQKLLDVALSLTRAFNDLSPAAQGAFVEFGVASAVVGPLAIGVGNLALKILSLKEELLALQATGGLATMGRLGLYGAVGVAVGAAGLYGLNQWDQNSQAQIDAAERDTRRADATREAEATRLRIQRMRAYQTTLRNGGIASGADIPDKDVLERIGVRWWDAPGNPIGKRDMLLGNRDARGRWSGGTIEREIAKETDRLANLQGLIGRLDRQATAVAAGKGTKTGAGSDSGAGDVDFTANIINAMNSGVNMQRVGAQCANYVVNVLKRAGADVEGSNLAGVLARNLLKAGATKVKPEDRQPGDIAVYYGKGYGAVKDARGMGYHIGMVSEDRGIWAGDSDAKGNPYVKKREFYGNPVILRLPDSAFNGKAAERAAERAKREREKEIAEQKRHAEALAGIEMQARDRRFALTHDQFEVAARLVRRETQEWIKAGMDRVEATRIEQERIAQIRKEREKFYDQARAREQEADTQHAAKKRAEARDLADFQQEIGQISARQHLSILREQLKDVKAYSTEYRQIILKHRDIYAESIAPLLAEMAKRDQEAESKRLDSEMPVIDPSLAGLFGGNNFRPRPGAARDPFAKAWSDRLREQGEDAKPVDKYPENPLKEFAAEYGKKQDIFRFIAESMHAAVAESVRHWKGFAGTFKNILGTIRDVFMDLISQMIAKWAIMGILSLFPGGKAVGAALYGGKFADGGRPPVGRVSLVGERGPELWVPDGAGTIIPNDKIGGNTTTINVQLNTGPVDSMLDIASAGRQLAFLIKQELPVS